MIVGVAMLAELLEAFDPGSHPRGWHGRWVGTSRGKVLRVFHGQASVGDVPASSRPKLVSGVRDLVGDSSRTISSSEIAHVVDNAAGSPAPTPRVYAPGQNANEPRRGRFIATFDHPVHGRTTSPVEASSGREASSKAEQQARASGSVVQNVTPFNEAARRIGKGEAHAEAAGRSRQLHAQITKRLENLPMGRFHSEATTGGHVRRTPAGFEVYGHGDAKPAKVHRTPSAAAGHLLRLRKASSVAESVVLGSLLEGGS